MQLFCIRREGGMMNAIKVSGADRGRTVSEKGSVFRQGLMSAKNILAKFGIL